MAICPKCGKNMGDNLYCRECGTALNASPPSAQIEGPGMSNKKTMLAVAIAVVVIIAAGAGYFFLMEKMNSAEITVNVHSTQSTPINVTVNINGDQKLSYERLGPGESIQNTFSINAANLTLGLALVFAVSTGGESGTVTDGHWIFVEKRGKYTVDLFL
jgi:hypothetical protein